MRAEIVDAYLTLDKMGLNRASSGNISLRDGDNMLITPSGISAGEMREVEIAEVALNAKDGAWKGTKKPSTEWRFHQDLLNSRHDLNAIVHTHAPFCTILAIARKPIPAIHYMIAAFGGSVINVADYACYGTEELSAAVVRAMNGRKGCLMANHGMLVGAENLTRAVWLAGELEALATQYYHALTIGGGHVLTDEEIAIVAKGFESYGVQ